MVLPMLVLDVCVGEVTVSGGVHALSMCRGYNRHDPTDEKERKKHPYSIIANKNGRNYYAMYATFLEIEFLFSQFTKRPTFI